MRTGEMEKAPYLTFTLDKELFALPIIRVREVLDLAQVTKMPGMPDSMQGAISVRGRETPVLDLRLKLGMSRTMATVNTCIIIADAVVDGEPTAMGLLADSLEGVIWIDPYRTDPAPRTGTRLAPDFVLGIGKCEKGPVVILDIDKVFTAG